MTNVLQIGEHETKFSFPNYRSRVVRQYLGKFCSPDPLYPEGIISSIYFDTREFLMLEEKLGSDFLKIKVRLRWYSSVNTKESYPALFLEIKKKIGSARKKVRFKLDFNSDWVLSRPLHDPCFLHINKLISTQGEHFKQPLYPVFQINYRRSRYIDSLSGARLSIDSDIHVARINGQMINSMNKTPLKEAVFEHKSGSHNLPDWLSQVNTIGNCKKGSFSKYSECYAHLL